MSFGQRVRKPSKVRTLEVTSDHLMQHFHSFLLAGGLIARDEVLMDYPHLPNIIKIKLRKVTEDKYGSNGS